MLAIREECLCKPQPQLRGLSEKSCSIFSRCYSGSPELHGSYGTRNLWIIASNFCLFSALVVTLTAKEEGNSTVWIEIWNHRLNFRFFFFFKVTFSVVKTMIFFFSSRKYICSRFLDKCYTQWNKQKQCRSQNNPSHFVLILDPLFVSS